MLGALLRMSSCNMCGEPGFESSQINWSTKFHRILPFVSLQLHHAGGDLMMSHAIFLPGLQTLNLVLTYTSCHRIGSGPQSRTRDLLTKRPNRRTAFFNPVDYCTDHEGLKAALVRNNPEEQTFYF